MSISIEQDGFGFIKRPDYRCYEIVRRYTMTNKRKSSVRLITWGGGIQSIRVPNSKGIIGDVVLGYDSMDGYLKNSKHFDNITSQTTNIVSSDNQPHNPIVNWESCIVGDQVVMSNLSQSVMKDYPGEMLTQVKFSWTNENQLHINIRGSSTKPIPANVTTRCLLNLAGHGTGSNELRNHIVTINASKWTFMDVKNKVPNGAIRSVDSTIYDLRFPTPLTKQRLSRVPGGGYDHNLCIDSPSSWCYRFHARILHPGSGRFMEVYSNQPGIQFYTGNNLPDPLGRSHPQDFDNCCLGGCGDAVSSEEEIGGRLIQETPFKNGVLYKRHGGFSLSPQNYPNAINTVGFPTCILYPGKIYANDTTYKFGVVGNND